MNNIDKVKLKWDNKVEYYLKNIHYSSNETRKIKTTLGRISGVFNDNIWESWLNMRDIVMVHRRMVL